MMAAASENPAEEGAPRSPEGMRRLVGQVWQEVLGRPVAHDRTFFEHGGRSVQLPVLRSRLRDRVGVDVSLTELMSHGTVEALAARLLSGRAAPAGAGDGAVALAAPRRPTLSGPGDDRIAVIGMACRFPEAASPEAYWANLVSGRSAIRRFTPEELRAAGVPDRLIEDPRYVPVAGHLQEAAKFDAETFGMSAMEARITDPQQRLFLECVWEALERAGHHPRRLADRRVGCFGGVGMALYAGTERASYFHSVLARDPDLLAELAPLQISFGNDNDHLCTRVSYRLGLRGPSLTVQTACSTGLVSVHLAARALAAGDCDMAVAGAAAVQTPPASGYVFRDGGILSPDGVCRVFDASSRGTVGGSGAGVVVLRRLADALADGDPICAVIRGSAVNNDGARRMAYSAPSVEGQVEVVRAALAAADVTADRIGYVEAHGTGTTVGDPIEFTALTRAFSLDGAGRGRCALGTVKPSVGHLDSAAGMAGLIKTVLTVQHGMIPPTLNHRTPHPEIDLAASPFHIPTESTPWRSQEGEPRLAGVSSFGAGGTNAHVIVEQAPALPPAAHADDARDEVHLLALSAPDAASLRALADDYRRHLRDHPELTPGEVGATIREGRPVWRHRAAVLGSDTATWTRRLAAAASPTEDSADAAGTHRVSGSFTGVAPSDPQAPVFLYSGQGSRVARATAELALAEPEFREAVRSCDALLSRDLHGSLYELVLADAQRLRTEARWAQPLLFTFQYALTRLWESWGVTPGAVLGHSLGEYAAACAAGIFDQATALELVATRGRLMDEYAARGSMWAVSAAPERVSRVLAGGAEIAVVNGPSSLVVAGPEEDVAATVAALGPDSTAVALETTHPFHCAAVEAMLAPFAQVVSRAELRPAALPMAPAMGGTAQVPALDSPEYWVRQVREPVWFADALRRQADSGSRAFLEIGPSSVLSGIGRTITGEKEHLFVPSTRPPGFVTQVRRAQAELFTAGLIDRVPAPGAAPARRRVLLPPSARPRRTYWAGPSRPAPGETSRPLLHDVVWTPDDAPRPEPSGEALSWLVIGADSELRAALAGRVRERGEDLLILTTAPAGTPEGVHTESDGLWPAVEGFLDRTRGLWRIVQIVGDGTDRRPPTCAPARWNDLRDTRSLFQRLAMAPRAAEGCLGLILPATAAMPAEHSAIKGFARAVSAEHPRLRHLCIEVPGLHADRFDVGFGVDAVFDDLAAGQGPREISYARGGRHVPRVREHAEGPRAGHRGVRPDGTYLVTGAGGALGSHVVTWLAEAGARHIVALGRSARGVSGQAAAAVRTAGADLLTARADITDPRQVRALLEHLERGRPPLRGVIHAAGVLRDATLAGVDDAALAEVIAPKATGAWLLDKYTEGRELDFFICFSSIAAVFGAPGQSAYSAANAAMAGVMRQRRARGLPGTAVHWGPWAGGGMYTTTRGRTRDTHFGRLSAMDPRDALRALAVAVAESPADLCVLTAADAGPALSPPPQDSGLAEWTDWLWRADAAPPAERGGTDSGRPVRRAGSEKAAAPLSPAELTERLRAEVGRVTGTPEEEIEDDRGLADLGLDSLTSLRLRERLHDSLGVDLPPTYLYSHPTVTDLAAHLAAAVASAPGALGASGPEASHSPNPTR